jgi:hypothetical protein
MDGFFKIGIIQEFQSKHEGMCLELLHQGYQLMLSERLYDIDWEEDTLSAHYIDLMQKLPICNEWQVDIVAQFYLYSDKHALGEEEAKFAPRIDFRFTKWFDSRKIDYFAEAKNLSERNWVKKKGTKVDASYYYNRYIKTGISHLTTNYYPNNCILIAYVLNGDKNVVISNLNKLISSNPDYSSYGSLKKPAPPSNDELYISENNVGDNNLLIKHLFLQLCQA